MFAINQPPIENVIIRIKYRVKKCFARLVIGANQAYANGCIRNGAIIQPQDGEYPGWGGQQAFALGVKPWNMVHLSNIPHHHSKPILAYVPKMNLLRQWQTIFQFCQFVSNVDTNLRGSLPHLTPDHAWRTLRI